MQLLFVLLCGVIAASWLPAFEPLCSEAGTNVEITNCLFAEYQKADTALNAIYQKALKRAADEGDIGSVKLRDAQGKWLAYRDADCEARYLLYGGGSGGPAEKASCLLELTQRRTSDLKITYGLDEKAR